MRMDVSGDDMMGSYNPAIITLSHLNIFTQRLIVAASELCQIKISTCILTILTLKEHFSRVSNLPWASSNFVIDIIAS